MGTLKRGLLLGTAYGLAVAVVNLGLLVVPTIQRRFGPGPSFLWETALLVIALGALLGLVGAPLLRLRFWRVSGTMLAVVWLTLSWLGLEWFVPFEAPLALPLMIGPPLGALLLVPLGLWMTRWRVWLPWALGGLLLAVAIMTPGVYIAATAPPKIERTEPPPAPEGAPDIVLVVLDTVRAANVSAYGYARKTAPTLETLAREGVLYSDATAPSTWSMPSHASLFTGRYPSSHGAHGENLVLDDRFPTLAQVLSARGYETFCFTSNAWISDGLGLTRGFGWQDGSWRETGGAGRNFIFIHRLLDRLGFGADDKGGAIVTARFGEWMRERPADARPSFVFLNFIEAHFPYHQLPREYVSRYTDRALPELEDISMALMAQQFGGPGRDPAEAGPPARDMYDGGVLYTDLLLQRVVEAIRARGSLDRTILVVLADHGEILGERAGFFGHGPSLYQQAVSVPLLVRYPPKIPAGARVEAPVSTVGVFATILDLADIEAPPTLQVGSLAPLANGSDEDPGPVLSEIMKATFLGGEPPSFPDPLMHGD
ncbi:MAG: sulfatase-like hydrolase/transferase, partial [Myxococcota bacterium]